MCVFSSIRIIDGKSIYNMDRHMEKVDFSYEEFIRIYNSKRNGLKCDVLYAKIY